MVLDEFEANILFCAVENLLDVVVDRYYKGVIDQKELDVFFALVSVRHKLGEFIEGCKQ